VIFAGDLAAKVLAGDKTVTRRLVSDNPRSPWHAGPKVGRTYAVQDGRGRPALGRIEIVSARTELMDGDYAGNYPLSMIEARREGFDTPAEFSERFKQMHGENVHGPLLVWRIEFKLA
jgi:hypothetical protein